MKKMSEKIYLQLAAPTEEDFRSSAQRITDSLQDQFGPVHVPVQTLRKLYPCARRRTGRLRQALPGTAIFGY